MPADKSIIEITKKIIFAEVDICSTNRADPAKINIIGMLISSLMFRLKFSETRKYTPSKKIIEPRKTDNLFCLMDSL
jgi:hypothetical protein